ncbi:MAG: 5'-deoxynucleotidase [Ruminococcus sp.]|nr:5'-deoxynucleotidase [Ruminococcus sp.]
MSQTENNSFFALTSRMKYINRWGLMRNTRNENIAEHSLDTAIIAHLLCVLRNDRFGGNVDPDRAAVLAIFHDTTEIITGDLPTPVKYLNPEIRTAYKDVEAAAVEKLLGCIPEDIRGEYDSIFKSEDKELLSLVKAADKISALIKCIEERKSGNRDFEEAEKQTFDSIRAMGIPEANMFLDEFLPAYELTLDEQA